jgi:hypothetical protein
MSSAPAVFFAAFAISEFLPNSVLTSKNGL